MSTPDVRVRLSPEGINEVIFALRRLQQEGKKTNAESAKSVGVLNSALGDLKSLLPTLGLAAVVGGFLAMAKQAVATADATGKIQQRVGGTVEEISGLTLAFRTNESDQAGLQRALQQTAVFMGRLQTNSDGAREAFESIGGSAKELEGLGTPRALEAIAKRLANIPPGAERAAAAQKIFAKNSADLLIALDAVGEQGIDAFIARARELGVLIDEDLANAAARANDALGIIKIQAEGLATQFAAGLAPAVADAMETFSEAVTGDGVSGMEKLGQVIGFVVRLAAAQITALGNIFGAVFAAIGVQIESTADALAKLVVGDFKGAFDAVRSGLRQQLAIGRELKAEVTKLGKDLLAAPSITPRPDRAGAGDTGAVDARVAEEKKIAAARLAARKAALQDELKLQQEALKSEEQALKTSYEQNLVSLQQYFDKRRELLARENAAELAALRLERQALVQQLNSTTVEGGPEGESDRIKLRQELARIDAQIRQQQIAAAREAAALDAEQITAQKELQKEQLAAANEIDEAEGRRHAVFQRNLDEEIAKLRELGVRAGQSADEVEAQIQRLTAARTSQFNLDEVARRGEAALAAFQRDAEQIRRDQEAGIITQFEGEQRLIELERERLGVLQQLAQQLLIAAEATGSEEQIEKARQFADSIDQIAASYQGATDVAAQFRTGALDAIESGIENLLANADKLESVEDAFRSLAQTVASALTRIAAEILARQAILALINAFGGAGAQAGSAAGSFASQAVGPGGYYGGLIRGYAQGGDVRGKRLPIRGPDKIPILAQEGEFVVRRARVMEPGALEFLRQWNGGGISLARALRAPRFAAGGEIGAATGTPPSAGGERQPRERSLRIINVVDPELAVQGLATASGERAVMNVIRGNATSIRRMLGGGA